MHPTLRSLIGLLAPLSFLASLPAASLLAAEREDPDPDFSVKDTVRVGPFHAAPFLVIKDFGYDDNVRLGAESRTSDYTVTVGPGARAVIPLGRFAALSLWDEIDYSMYARQTDLNSVNNEFRAKTHVYLRDVTVFLEGHHRTFRERPNFEVDFRIRDTSLLTRAGAAWRPTGRASLEMSVNKIDFGYDAGRPDVPEGEDPDEAAQTGENIADILAREETSSRFTGRLKLRPRTTFLLDLSTGKIDFVNDRHFDPGDPVRDSSQHSGMAGVEFDPSGSLRGYMKVGYKKLTPVDSSFSGYDGLIADGALSARILGRGDVRARFGRDTYFSVFGNNLYYVQEDRGLSYEHYLTGRVSLEVGREHHDIDYPIVLEGQHSPRRKDDIVQDKVTLRYKIGPGLRVGLSVGHWRRDSTVDSEDDDRNTITTMVEYIP
ncbi:MAG TPA: outer membrane beta-barrel protein [Candidatus Polarisedimenticolia bacterium]|nr:outer membrane beta-barrel protein [Candidatus Polarisedimenticolia bacterium]